MLHRYLWKAGFWALAGCGSMTVGGQQIPSVMPKLSITSVPDNVLSCKRGAPECKITVRIEAKADGSCQAIIDPHEIRIAKNTKVNFLLARSTMEDTNTYSFLGQGITWTGSPPTSDQFAFVQITPDGTVAQWATGKSKTSTDLGFVPLVKRVSGDVLCGAGDPVIANDG